MASNYSITYDADLRCYPNYSFEIGDLDGDGRMEFVCLNQTGNRLRAVRLDGSVVFERRLSNFGNWGTVILALADLDGDGRQEVIAPCLNGSRFARIGAYDAEGKEIRSYCFGTRTRDAYGIAVPLLAAMQFQASSPKGVFAGIAGGTVVALDSEFNELWRLDGLRRDFGHEPHVADFDGDGLDEVAFCTVDDINRGRAADNAGELIVLDHDGSILLRRDVGDYANDTHFDDVAIVDFRGTGQAQVLLEKGVMLSLGGEALWDVSGQLDHGQWIAHAPDPVGKGRIIFISELWGGHKGGSALISPDGRVRWTIRSLPRTVLNPTDFHGWRVLPTRPHLVQWTEDSEPELFLAEQAYSPTSHDCFETRAFELKAFFLDIRGNLLGTLPFPDAQVEDYWYNGEVHSRVADVDGDGQQEVVFPRQNGRVKVIKKRLDAGS